MESVGSTPRTRYTSSGPLGEPDHLENLLSNYHLGNEMDSILSSLPVGADGTHGFPVCAPIDTVYDALPDDGFESSQSIGAPLPPSPSRAKLHSPSPAMQIPPTQPGMGNKVPQPSSQHLYTIRSQARTHTSNSELHWQMDSTTAYLWEHSWRQDKILQWISRSKDATIPSQGHGPAAPTFITPKQVSFTSRVEALQLGLYEHSIRTQRMNTTTNSTRPNSRSSDEVVLPVRPSTVPEPCEASDVNALITSVNEMETLQDTAPVLPSINGKEMLSDGCTDVRHTMGCELVACVPQVHFFLPAPLQQRTARPESPTSVMSPLSLGTTTAAYNPHATSPKNANISTINIQRKEPIRPSTTLAIRSPIRQHVEVTVNDCNHNTFQKQNAAIVTGVDTETISQRAQQALAAAAKNAQERARLKATRLERENITYSKTMLHQKAVQGRIPNDRTATLTRTHARGGGSGLNAALALHLRRISEEDLMALQRVRHEQTNKLHINITRLKSGKNTFIEDGQHVPTIVNAVFKSPRTAAVEAGRVSPRLAIAPAVRTSATAPLERHKHIAMSQMGTTERTGVEQEQIPGTDVDSPNNLQMQNSLNLWRYTADIRHTSSRDRARSVGKTQNHFSQPIAQRQQAPEMPSISQAIEAVTAAAVSPMIPSTLQDRMSEVEPQKLNSTTQSPQEKPWRPDIDDELSVHSVTV